MTNNRHLVTVFLLIFGMGGPIVYTDPTAASQKSLNELPAPVQAYILREAVEAGVEFPWNITVNGDYDGDFGYPNVPDNDVNADGQRDYAVALCMFAENTPQFLTNGYPCAFGSLILSRGEGYSFVPVSGIVVESAATNPPIVIVRQRQFGDECSNYVCDFKYRIEYVDGLESFELIRMNVCLPDEC